MQKKMKAKTKDIVKAKKPFPNPETQFSTTNQPANRGRKKKLLTIIKEMGYTGDDIKTAFKELAFYSLPELVKVSNDNEKPAILRITAEQFITAYKKKDYNRIKEIIQYILGKPLQQIETKNYTEQITGIIIKEDK